MDEWNMGAPHGDPVSGQLLLAPRSPAGFRRGSSVRLTAGPVVSPCTLGRTWRTRRVPCLDTRDCGFDRSIAWMEVLALRCPGHAVLPLRLWLRQLNGTVCERRRQAADASSMRKFRPGQRQKFTMKRLFDLMAAAIALVFLSPLFLLIALLLRATSRGPAFYSRKRVGF